MTDRSGEKLFIIIKRTNNIITGHAVKSGDVTKDDIDSVFSKNQKEDEETTTASEDTTDDTPAVTSPYPESFLDVERSFSQAMLMYRNSVIETISVAPILANVRLGGNIEKIVNDRGTKVDDLSSGEIEVYSLPDHASYSIMRHKKRADALKEGALHLPKISTIGIISSYDAILTDLLRVIFTLKPEIVFTSEREIKFSDLTSFGSIEAAKNSIVSNEIDSVVRQSHHEQFSWMEKKFRMQLREGLNVWPDFIELCERRNLLTHTGGIVSEQYLKNCTAFGKRPDVQIGDKLNVDLDYLKKAIRIVSEVGYKLIHTMWRKFSPDERKKADGSLNEFGMNLIAAKEYDLAEKILDFGVNQKTHSSELIKRMMIVNLANAAKLAGCKDRSDKVLSAHDWSATSYKFQISVAAVKNDFQEVQRLLLLGSEAIEITASDFRDWPVFRDARKEISVQKVFEKVFDEPLVKPEPMTSTPDPQQEDDPDEDNESE